MHKLWMTIPALFLALAAHAADDAGFTPLFNGKDLSGWTLKDGSAIKSGWQVEDGVLHRADKGGDIYTEKEYANFEFRFEWMISPGGNSGIKYRMHDYEKKGTLGPEYQVLDDAKHPDALITNKRHAASLYDILAAPADKKINEPGQWNEGRVIARGTHLEHWLNGVKTIEVEVGSHRWKELIAASKFKNVPGFAENPSGRIQLQDHGNKVWYRNLRIKEL